MSTSGNWSAILKSASCQVECASMSCVPFWAYCASTRVTPAVSCGAFVVTSRSMSPRLSSALAASKPCLHQGSLVAHGRTMAVFTLSWPPPACSPPPPSPLSSSPQAAAPIARTAVARQTRTALHDVLLIIYLPMGITKVRVRQQRSLGTHPLSEGSAERGGLGIPPRQHRCGHHHDKRDHVRQRSEDLRRDGGGDAAADGLNPDLKCVGEAKEKRAAEHKERLPAAEDHERDRDPAASTADVLLEDVELAEHEYRAAEARHAAADEQREPAYAGHRHRHGLGRRRALAHRADRQTEAGPGQQDAYRQCERQRDVEEDVLLEQHRSDAGDRVEQRDLYIRDAGDRRLLLPTEELLEGEQGDPLGHQNDRYAVDDLLGPEGDAEKRHQRAHDHAYRHTGQRPEGDAPEVVRDEERDQRSGEQHPLEPEVEHAGALGDGLADRRQRRRHGEGDTAAQEHDERVGAEYLGPVH